MRLATFMLAHNDVALSFRLQDHGALSPVVITSGDSSSDEDGTSVVSVVMESTASPLASHHDATEALLGRRKRFVQWMQRVPRSSYSQYLPSLNFGSYSCLGVPE